MRLQFVFLAKDAEFANRFIGMKYLKITGGTRPTIQGFIDPEMASTAIGLIPMTFISAEDGQPSSVWVEIEESMVEKFVGFFGPLVRPDESSPTGYHPVVIGRGPGNTGTKTTSTPVGKMLTNDEVATINAKAAKVGQRGRRAASEVTEAATGPSLRELYGNLAAEVAILANKIDQLTELVMQQSDFLHAKLDFTPLAVLPTVENAALDPEVPAKPARKGKAAA